MSILVLFQRRRRMIYHSIIWMIMTMMSTLHASSFSVLISADSFVNILSSFFFLFFLAATSFNIKGLTYYKNNEEDPYITLKDVCMPFPFPFESLLSNHSNRRFSRKTTMTNGRN